LVDELRGAGISTEVVQIEHEYGPGLLDTSVFIARETGRPLSELRGSAKLGLSSRGCLRRSFRQRPTIDPPVPSV